MRVHTISLITEESHIRELLLFVYHICIYMCMYLYIFIYMCKIYFMFKTVHINRFFFF